MISARDWDTLALQVYQANRSQGFYDSLDGLSGPNVESVILTQRLALIATEVGEAIDAVRKPGPSEHIPEFSGLEEELADVVIRILDLSGYKRLRVAEAIQAKLEYNQTRPKRHGKLM